MCRPNVRGIPSNTTRHRNKLTTFIECHTHKLRTVFTCSRYTTTVCWHRASSIASRARARATFYGQANVRSHLVPYAAHFAVFAIYFINKYYYHKWIITEPQWKMGIIIGFIGFASILFFILFGCLFVCLFAADAFAYYSISISLNAFIAQGQNGKTTWNR